MVTGSSARLMSKNDDEPIFKVDTIPPPPGESDVYSAPTKVGPMAASLVEEMLLAAKKSATERQEAALRSQRPETPDSQRARPRPEAPPPVVAPSEPVVTVATTVVAVPRPATPIMAFPPPSPISPISPLSPPPPSIPTPAPAPTPLAARPPTPAALPALGPLLEPEAPAASAVAVSKPSRAVLLLTIAMFAVALASAAYLLLRR